MQRWTIDVSEEFDRQVRRHAAEHNSGEVSAFVQKAVRRQMLRETIEKIRARNADAPPDVIEDEVNQAVKETRANRH